MNNRRPVYRSEALAQQENTDDFEQIARLTRIQGWMVWLALGSLLIMLVFCGILLFGVVF